MSDFLLQALTTFFALSIAAVAIQNMVFARALSISRLLSLVDDTTSTGIFGGLLIGGMLAAPLAASLCKKLPLRPLMVLIGGLIVILNLYNLLAWTGRL